jgi:hypothetical protein
VTGHGARRVVKGFVVKKEVVVVDPSTQVRNITRTEVSRIYHSRDAANVCCDMFKKHNPGTDYYVHEKTGGDDSQIY